MTSITISTLFRILRMGAAIIGATGALWLLSGDRNPDAAPRIESSLGVTADMPRIVGMSGTDPFTASIMIAPHDAFDFRGIQFFELHLGKGVRVTLSADGDLDLTRWLQAHKRERVLLTLTPAQTLSR